MAAKATKRKTSRGTKRKTALLTSDSAVRALTSPLRVEILHAFAGGAELTVRDLSQRLGKPRGSLYYHVRKLVDIGALAEAEQRLVGRRYESVYRAVADRIAVGTDASSASGRAAAARLVLSTLRQAGREFETALESGLMDDLGGTELGTRLRVWLTDRDRAQVTSLLSRVEELCERANKREKGRLYAITNLIVPLADGES